MIARGLVGWWRLDGRLVDESGNGNNATVGAGSAAYAPGKFGQAWDNNTTRYLDTGSETLGDGLFAGSDRRWTVAIWFKVSSSSEGTVIGRAITIPVADRTFQIYFGGTGPTGVPAVIIRGNAVNMPTSLRDGQWHHIAVTWDGSLARRYVDGAFIDTQSSGTAAENTGQRIIIGARTNGEGFRLTGQIQNATIFNRALAAHEIRQLYAMGSPIGIV